MAAYDKSTDLTSVRHADQQTQLLAAVLLDSNDAVSVHDFEGNITFWNRGAEQMYGYSSTEAMQMNVEQMIPEELRAKIREIWMRIRQGQSVDSWDALRRTKDGRILEISVKATALRDETGQPVAIVKTERDITERNRTEDKLRVLNETLEKRINDLQHESAERKWVEEALRRRNDELAAVLDSIPALVWLAQDAHCTVVEGNRAVHEMFGAAAGTNLSQANADSERAKHFVQFLKENGDEYRHHELPIAQAVALQQPIRDKVLDCRLPDGRKIVVLGNAVPLFDEAGSVRGAVGVFIDITERKRAEEKIRESEQRYRELIQGLPVALYTTDADGYLTLYNEVASKLWGRRPVLGKDRWGGFSKVYKINGIPLPHERSPMAIAIQENRRFKEDRELIGERPDGTCVTFLAHPMPFQDSSGKIVGAINILVDISERKRSEDLLREQQEFLRAILNTASDAIITINAMGIIQSMNAATERMFGYTAAELVGRNIKTLIPSPYREEHDDGLIDHSTTRVKKIVGTGREVAGRRKNGSTFPIDLAFSEVVPFELFTGILRDITERKQAELALRESMLFARSTLDGLSAHIAILDEAGTILAVNQSWRDFAAANDAIPGSTEEGSNYLTACDRSAGPNSKEASLVAAGIRAVLASEMPEFVAEYSCHSAQKKRWFIVRVTPFPGDGPRRVVVAHEDVGRRKELEQEVVEIASHEQRRIGQELHDGVGQELTALNMLTDDLTEILNTDPFESSKLVEQISKKLKRAQQELRSVLLGLLPGPVDAQGLVIALADLADRIQKEGKVTCTFDCPGPISLDDDLAATHLYLIAQEAVHNALKHARSKNIGISLTSNDVLVLDVRDDGIGAQVKPAKSLKGLGLRIMQNRAAIINATLTVEPAVPTGTLVTCTLSSKRHETKNDR